MLFTCALVLSCTGGKRRYASEIWIVGTNSKILGGPGQTRKIHGKRASKRFRLTLEWGPDRRIRKVLQEDGCSIMYKVYDCIVVPKENCHELSAVYHPCLIILPMIICVYTSGFLQYWSVFFFLQVKNKPWLPWVYAWIRHRRRSLSLWRVVWGSKLMLLDSLIHGLFIT